MEDEGVGGSDGEFGGNGGWGFASLVLAAARALRLLHEPGRVGLMGVEDDLETRDVTSRPV